MNFKNLSQISILFRLNLKQLIGKKVYLIVLIFMQSATEHMPRPPPPTRSKVKKHNKFILFSREIEVSPGFYPLNQIKSFSGYYLNTVKKIKCFLTLWKLQAIVTFRHVKHSVSKIWKKLNNRGKWNDVDNEYITFFT